MAEIFHLPHLERWGIELLISPPFKVRYGNLVGNRLIV